MTTTIILSIAQFIFVPALSPALVGLIRKLKARFQNRQGASIFQPYKDIWKLFHKDEVISKDASWIFYTAPFIIFAVTLVVGASIPVFASLTPHMPTSDILVIVYMLALGTFFLALAGMDTGSAFGGFGSSREMTISTLAEGGLVFSLLATALIHGTTDVFSIAASAVSQDLLSFLPVVLAFMGFFIALLAETARFPFDNPATHLELTMIHEAMILEYSGKKLALLEWASANKLVIFFMLGANVFFPIGLAASESVGALIIGLSAFFLKLGVFAAIIAVIESVMAKFRFFRLPDLLIVSFILNAVAIGLIYL